MAIVVVVALLLSSAVRAFVAQPFSIPSGSMESTLEPGDRVVVSRFTPRFSDIKRGDVVVFADPGGWLDPSQTSSQSTGWGVKILEFVGLRAADGSGYLIKRVIGVGGDEVSCCDAQGRVEVNGTAIDEPYLKEGSQPSEIEFDVVVPADSIWVMGDNRQDSWDSRYHLGDPGGGFIPVSRVVGVAVARVWPASRWAILHNPGDTFAAVPDPTPSATPSP